MSKLWNKNLNHINLAMVFLLAVVMLYACGRPLYEPNKEARRISAQLISMSQNHGAILEDRNAEGYDLELFPKIFRNARDQYVYPVDDQTLLAAAFEGVRVKAASIGPLSLPEFDEAATTALLSSLDDYSGYMDAKAYRSFQEQTNGAYAGLGIQVTGHEKGILVISPFEGSPADRVGIEPGDVITHADGIVLEELELDRAISYLRGRVGTSVRITVAREGVAPFEVSIQRDIVRIESVRHQVEGNVGYIRITSFNDEVGSKLRDAIAKIEGEIGFDNLYGYVLDLRANPGGLLTEAIAVTESFMEGGIVVKTKDRHSAQEFKADRSDRTSGKPVVVLIDKGSASASEIVAGALKDHERATLLGEKTFGKGSVQTVFPLYNGGVKLTTALYFTPDGHTVNGGIQPEYTVEDDPDQDGDEQLLAAYRLIVELAGGPQIYWGAGTSAQ